MRLSEYWQSQAGKNARHIKYGTVKVISCEKSPFAKRHRILVEVTLEHEQVKQYYVYLDEMIVDMEMVRKLPAIKLPKAKEPEEPEVKPLKKIWNKRPDPFDKTQYKRP